VSEATLVLAIETSCDETSAAVLRGPRDVLGHVILSQDAHALYGGVVPEIAARAHLAVLDDVVNGALAEADLSIRQLDAIAATAGPGLIGALLVGVTWGRAAAFSLGRPFVPVHHMEAHLFSTWIEDEGAVPPFVALLVSGGHTMLLHVPEWGRYELLGETRDDAAGEAFDKVAKVLGLPYPGGPVIDRLASQGEVGQLRFPRPMLKKANCDFSFSGMKTAVLTHIESLGAPPSAHRGEVRRLQHRLQARHLTEALGERAQVAVQHSHQVPGIRTRATASATSAASASASRAPIPGMRQPAAAACPPPSKHSATRERSTVHAGERRKLTLELLVS